MSENNIKTLRELLFDSIRDVKNAKTKDEVEAALLRAKQISETSQTIINSVKAEIDYVRATGDRPSSDFIPALSAQTSTTPKPAVRQIPTGTLETFGNITRHKPS